MASSRPIFRFPEMANADNQIGYFYAFWAVETQTFSATHCESGQPTESINSKRKCLAGLHVKAQASKDLVNLLTYEIEKEDFYEDIKDDVKDLFYTSIYDKNRPSGYTDVNKKVLCMLKD